MDFVRETLYRAFSEVLKEYCKMVDKPPSEGSKDLRKYAMEYFDRDLVIREVARDGIVDSMVLVRCNEGDDTNERRFRRT